jgi:hypothetical protein
VRINRGLLGLGVFLVTVGIVMLAVRQGLVAAAVAQRAWTLWPLLLVAAGLSIVLAGRREAIVGGLLSAVTFGAIVGGIAASGFGIGFGGCAPDRSGAAFAEQNGALGAGAAVSVVMSCGDLRVGTVAGTTWSLTGSSPDGRPPTVRARGDLSIEAHDATPFGSRTGRNDWTVIVPGDAGIVLKVTTNGGASDVALAGASLASASFETNAGSLTVDLTDAAAIGSLDVRTNLGSTTIRFPNRSVTTTLSVNAGSAAICVPDGVGVRIRLDSVAASNDFSSHGLGRIGDAWESPGYATATARVAIDAEVNAGSIALDPVRECAG